jgi:hypothetical protein
MPLAQKRHGELPPEDAELESSTIEEFHRKLARQFLDACRAFLKERDSGTQAASAVFDNETSKQKT